jgi:RNA polymerase sigma-70 factor (sigma-E family)
MTSRPTDAEFTEFVDASWPRLYRVAWLLLGDHGLAEDLVQTTLAKTYVSWHQIRDTSAAGVYARTVLVNTATSWFRRRSWRRELATEVLPETAHEYDGSTQPDLARALADLPTRQRAVVVLRFYEDLDVADVARVLGITAGTVKSQTFHALAKLRVSLGEAFVPEGATHD